MKRPITHPNVLILAVEQLTPEDLQCNEDFRPGVQSGLDLLCRDAITVGPIRSYGRGSLPDLASFLFEQTPEQMEVSDNGANVRADFESTAEIADQRGWSTVFIGSSPLFMRRSGLAQGFEHFEESAQIESNRWGRSRLQVTQSFQKWISDRSSVPFYAVVSYSDLNFPWVRSTNLGGQERDRTVESQADAVFESWLPLIRSLKEQKIYDNTWIIVLGIQGRNETRRVGALVKPPPHINPKEFSERVLSLDEFSVLFHQRLFQLPQSPATSPPISNLPSLAKWKSGAFWTVPLESYRRSQFLETKVDDEPKLIPWLLYEYLEQSRPKDFIKWSLKAGPVDAAPFWDRIQSSRKTQILQDPCLRMIDLKIFEGGGSKTCESPTLIALQDWMRQTETSAEESLIREARQRTLRNLHELRSIRRIHMVNSALGRALPLPLDVGTEILRTEMALRLPELQVTKLWLDQAEPSWIDRSE